MPLLISVIVPTFKRTDLLVRCLDCLSPQVQTIGKDLYEVIVTDDGQTSATELIKSNYPWVKWVAGPGLGPAANRNNGAQQASADWLAFIDDDCLAKEDWIAALVNAGQDPNVDVLEGKTIIPDKVDSPFKQGVENLHGGCYWSCNLAVRRTVFLTLNGFDQDFAEAGGEDMEFAWRIQSQKIGCCFVPEAIVLHPVRVLDWHNVIWRTFLIRWLLLYQLKTQRSAQLTESLPKSLLSVASERTISLLRDTWHLLSKFDSNTWRSRLFWQIWNIITFPVVLPYLLYWEWRFHNLLNNRH